jgi:hypothetical protein
MGARPGSLPGCAQVRTMVHKKDWCWSMALFFNRRELLEVMIARTGVAGVL